MGKRFPLKSTVAGLICMSSIFTNNLSVSIVFVYFSVQVMMIVVPDDDGVTLSISLILKPYFLSFVHNLFAI